MSKFYSQISTEFVDHFITKVQSAKSILITTHYGPDDDAISSVLSIYHYLIANLGLDEDRIKIKISNTPLTTWKNFTYFDKIEFVDDVSQNISTEDLLILLDISGWSRFTRTSKRNDFANEVICIDHHANPEEMFDLHTVVSPFSSTAELIYHLFYKDSLDSIAARLIFLGIAGDTGVFKYVTPETSTVLGVSEMLVNAGNIEVENFLSDYQSLELGSLKVVEEMLKNIEIKRINNWPALMTSFFTKEFITSNNLSEEEVRGGYDMFKTYLRSVRDVTWGLVCVSDVKQGMQKLSMRSLPGSVDVNQVMIAGNWGRGHKRAAGGKVEASSPQEGLNIVYKWLENNDPIIEK